MTPPPYDPTRDGPRRVVGPGFHERVRAVVGAVPAGAVTTYGDVAAALGHRNAARHVGWALAALPADDDTPWWRVVAANGRIAHAAAAEQRRRLAREGVAVRSGRVCAFAARRAALAPHGDRN